MESGITNFRENTQPNGNTKYFFYAAIREALTNTVKHTKGTKVMCRITEAGAKMCIEIENDGESPKKPIIEGGGLGNLRRMVQGAGG